MKASITLRYTPHLPTPLLLLANVDDLAAWHINALTQSYEQGARTLTLPCHTLGFDAEASAEAVFHAITVFLHHHRDVRHLTLVCGESDSCRAYATQLQKYTEY